MPKPATCHPDKPYFAKGFCKACYARDRRQKGLVDRTKYNRQAKYRQTEKGKEAQRRYYLRRKEREIAS